MKFHAPSFVWHLKRRFDITFDVYEHNWTLYLVTDNKYFSQTLLKDLIIEAMTDALDMPLNAPDGVRQRSLLDAPIDTHLDALQAALRERTDYVSFRTISTINGERFEWRVDLRMIQAIVSEVRKAQDVELCKHLIQGDLFVSSRLLEKKILHSVGVAFSDRRLRDALALMEAQGLIKGNGHLRTHGREVLL
jgi:hypothetical protein